MPEHYLVHVEDMMLCRERRMHRQEEMREIYGCPLISFGLNIAGPVKHTPLIERGFVQAVRKIKETLALYQIPIVAERELRTITGCEWLCACEGEAVQLKRLACLLEEADDFGRLLDIDILTAEGEKLDREIIGLPPRRCLLCDEVATVCARSRTHTADALFKRSNRLILDHLLGAFACEIGEMAQKSLLQEAITTPKPGLVDANNSGAHRDMDLTHFIKSACALRPYFEECVHLGAKGADEEATVTMENLRTAGRRAEQIMLKATGGINTHKGALYGMGILCGAAGRLFMKDEPRNAAALFETGGQIARREIDPIKTLATLPCATNGLKQYALHGVLGARGEAASGFPSAAEVGVPAFKAALKEGLSLNEACVRTLLHLMACVEDTNVLKRAGFERAKQLTEELRQLIKTKPTLETVRALDEALIAENISPGGCADLLSFTLFAFDYENSDRFDN